MNIENMTKLRDHLQWLLEHDRAYKFDMKHWLGYYEARTDAATIAGLQKNLRDKGISQPISATECGTVACIAGHAALIGNASKYETVYDFAQNWLGLDARDANHLFKGKWGRGLSSTLPSAIAHLTNLLERAGATPQGN